MVTDFIISGRLTSIGYASQEALILRKPTKIEEKWQQERQVISDTGNKDRIFL
jgi:hypothetical protein